MLVEIAGRLGLLCTIQRADMLRLAMDQTIGRSALFVLTTLCTPAYRPKIDQFSHSVLPEQQTSDPILWDTGSSDIA